MRAPNPMPIGEQVAHQMALRMAGYFQWLASDMKAYSPARGPLTDAMVDKLWRAELQRLRMPRVCATIYNGHSRRSGKLEVPDTKPMGPLIAIAKLMDGSRCKLEVINRRAYVYCEHEQFEVLLKHLSELPAVVTMIQRGQELYPPSLLDEKDA